MRVDLSKLGLDKAAIEARTRAIGGSDAYKIMSGDPEEIRNLWEEKTGRREPDDLSNVLPVIMGQFTEALNLTWFEKQTGMRLSAFGQKIIHRVDRWRTMTADAMVMDDDLKQGGPVPCAVVQAKHVNSFWKNDNLVAKYQPQLHHEMAVAGLSRAYMSVFKGNADWLLFTVDYDEGYAAEVRRAEWEFWMAVQSDEPPVPYAAPNAPRPVSVRELDMTKTNWAGTWGAYAVNWLDNHDAAKAFATSAEGLKSLVPEDVGRAWGDGVIITRNKAGAMTIKSHTEETNDG